ncbi:MAG TPA: hypothetical protein DCS93_40155 [Microscillaceae bacterium]|nr:hypothetical protein [Microscillaceae bacterium]
MTNDDLKKLINDGNLVDAFEWLDDHVPEGKKTTYNGLKDEFIQGKDDKKYIQRLKIFLNGLKKELFPIPVEEPQPAQKPEELTKEYRSFALESFLEKNKNYHQRSYEERQELDQLKREAFKEFFQEFDRNSLRDFPDFMFDRIISTDKLDELAIKELKYFVSSKESHYYEKCVVVSALTVSLMKQNTLDHDRLELLLDFVHFGQHEVWERALVGLVITLNNKSRKVNADFKHRLNELRKNPTIQEALWLINIAFHNFQKRVEGKSPIEYLISWAKEVEEKQLKVNDKEPKESDKQSLKKVPVGELIKDFSSVKNYTFFEKPQHWFLPFHTQNKLALASLESTIHDLNAEKFIRFLNGVTSWDNANKYAFCFHINDVPVSLIKIFNKVIDALEEAGEFTEGSSENINQKNTRRRLEVCVQFFMDVYRFFESYPSHQMEIGLWKRKRLYQKDLLKLIAEEIARVKIEAFNHFNADNYKQALQPFEKLTQLETGNAGNWANLGMIYLKLKNYDQALKAYQTALGIDKEDADWWNQLGVIWLKKRDFFQVEKVFKKSVEIDNSEENVKSILSILAKVLKEFPQTLKIYREILEVQPEFYEGWILLSQEYDSLGQYEKKAYAYEQALKVKPDNAVIWYNLGVIYGKINKLESEIEAYQKAIKIDPKLAEAWNNLGNSYGKLKNYASAVESYQKAIKIDPKLVQAWNNLGSAYFKLKDYEPAIKAYQKALKINPKLAEAWNNLGTTYGKLKDYGSAAEAYQKVLKIDPKNFEAWNNLGFVYLSTNDLKQAKTHFDKTLKLSKNTHSLAWQNLGHLELIANNSLKAKEFYQTSMQHYTNDRRGIKEFFEKMEEAFPMLEEQHRVKREVYDEVLKELRIYEEGMN